MERCDLDVRVCHIDRIVVSEIEIDPHKLGIVMPHQ